MILDNSLCKLVEFVVILFSFIPRNYILGNAHQRKLFKQIYIYNVCKILIIYLTLSQDNNTSICQLFLFCHIVFFLQQYLIVV